MYDNKFPLTCFHAWQIYKVYIFYRSVINDYFLRILQLFLRIPDEVSGEVFVFGYISLCYT